MHRSGEVEAGQAQCRTVNNGKMYGWSTSLLLGVTRGQFDGFRDLVGNERGFGWRKCPLDAQGVVRSVLGTGPVFSRSVLSGVKIVSERAPVAVGAGPLHPPPTGDYPERPSGMHGVRQLGRQLPERLRRARYHFLAVPEPAGVPAHAVASQKVTTLERLVVPGRSAHGRQRRGDHGRHHLPIVPVAINDRLSSAIERRGHGRGGVCHGSRLTGRRLLLLLVVDLGQVGLLQVAALGRVVVQLAVLVRDTVSAAPVRAVLGVGRHTSIDNANESIRG